MDDLQINELIRQIASLRKEVKSIRKLLLQKRKPCYTNQELIDLLGVSANTVRKWRDEGLIGYSKAGGCYLYSLADIEKFLADTHYDSFISED